MKTTITGFDFGASTLSDLTALEQEVQNPTKASGFTATVTATLEMSVSFNGDNSSLLNITQEVARNLWQLKMYMDLYIAQLQGGISEEEFENEAAKYVREKNILSIDQIKICSIYLKSLLPEIEIDDVASLLNVDFVDVARIMNGE